ncbi:hypothetical protein MKZ38_003182 [Zalerion maritima]|uniref:SGNH hydrolase-type esterase domain-containing protein n=1 Tax=Zalerion maritima TaxID=339359 RepID=A0AAD5RZ88_9PEZI|nr:hypothetical protein MKZ38_003182 [Zalerion maritima]
MASFSFSSLLLLSCAGSVLSAVPHPSPHANSLLAPRASDDASDFSWIKRWAAIGDSFSAGIGAGTGLYPSQDAYHCSRYNEAYPALLNEFFGSSVEDFQYTACSGDKSIHIYNQAKDLEGDLDLVVLTAGGNDMCLSKVIEYCIFRGWILTKESTCDTWVTEALNNLDEIIKDNLKSIVSALSDKVNDDGLVVFNTYAEYFNEASGDCNGECWYLFSSDPAVELSVERRQIFNEMVKAINKLIQEVVDEATDDDAIKFSIVTSDWNVWVTEAVDGQYCDPDSTGAYPDSGVPELQFFKPDTTCNVENLRKRELVRANDTRVLSEEDRMVLREMHLEAEESYAHNKALWETSKNPSRHVLGQLDPRQSTSPLEPLCGRSSTDETSWIVVPDFLGKMFHPNERGHLTIASFVMGNIINFRSKQLGTDNPMCAKADDFKCWKKEGNKGYVDYNLIYESKEDFCNNERPSDSAGWRLSKTYYKDTPEEHQFLIIADDDQDEFDEDMCHSSFKRILDGCDGNDSDNPLNWKSGGRWVHEGYTYEVNPKRDNRPWPPPKERSGICLGKTVGLILFDEYWIRGKGWSTWDYGKDTLLPAIKSCVGLGVTGWQFAYLDEPDWADNEWHAAFKTPVATKARCFDNNKVQFKAGGFSDGCHYEKTIE